MTVKAKTLTKKIVTSNKDAPVTRVMFSSLASEIRAKSSSHDHRFNSIDSRFDSMDKRFDSIDSRFDSMDKRFDSMDLKIDSYKDEFKSIHIKIDGYKVEIKSMYFKTQVEVDQQTANNHAMYDAIGAMVETLNRANERHDEFRTIVFNAKLPREV